MFDKIEESPVDRHYYLATSPDFYATICEHLTGAGMTAEAQARRSIVIEKPFGSDLASAMRLNRRVHAAFAEHQVFRIDHYPGKETAPNVLSICIQPGEGIEAVWRLIDRWFQGGRHPPMTSKVEVGGFMKPYQIVTINRPAALLLFAALLLTAAGAGAVEFDHTHAAYDALLKQFVADGRVDYDWSLNGKQSSPETM